MNNPSSIILIVVVAAVFILFQIRNTRKRNKDTAARNSAMLPGVEIMTNSGIYGKLISVNEDTNVAVIEIAPGTEIRIHRQTILKVVEDDEVNADAAVETEADAPTMQLNQDTAILSEDPPFGERTEPAVKKPVRRTVKKTDD